MPSFDTFSKRQKRREQAGQPDVYQYDELPMPFRIQVIHIWHSLNNRRYASQISDDTQNDAIDELNHRFREHNIGYQFTSGELIKVDSAFVHSEVVKPAISLLHNESFRGPEDEFLRAHEHYRHGRNKEAITEALKAFESTIKAICEARKWPYDKMATASKLIATIFDHGLIRPDMASYFAGFRSALESGLPTLRNKTSGHGQGKDPVNIPDHHAGFALHLAASNIVLLVESHKALP